MVAPSKQAQTAAKSLIEKWYEKAKGFTKSEGIGYFKWVYWMGIIQIIQTVFILWTLASFSFIPDLLSDDYWPNKLYWVRIIMEIFAHTLATILIGWFWKKMYEEGWNKALKLVFWIIVIILHIATGLWTLALLIWGCIEFAQNYNTTPHKWNYWITLFFWLFDCIGSGLEALAVIALTRGMHAHVKKKMLKGEGEEYQKMSSAYFLVKNVGLATACKYLMKQTGLNEEQLVSKANGNSSLAEPLGDSLDDIDEERDVDTVF